MGFWECCELTGGMYLWRRVFEVEDVSWGRFGWTGRVGFDVVGIYDAGRRVRKGLRESRWFILILGCFENAGW